MSERGRPGASPTQAANGWKAEIDQYMAVDRDKPNSRKPDIVKFGRFAQSNSMASLPLTLLAQPAARRRRLAMASATAGYQDRLLT